MIVGTIIRGTTSMAVIVELTDAIVDTIPVAEVEAALNSALAGLVAEAHRTAEARRLEVAGEIEVGRGTEL